MRIDACLAQESSMWGWKHLAFHNQASNKWSAQHFCHSAKNLILTVLLLRHFASGGLAAQKNGMAACGSLQAFALRIATVWNGALQTAKQGKEMHTVVCLERKGKTGVGQSNPRDSKIIQMWSKKVLPVPMIMWVKAISSRKGTLGSTHGSICTALREPSAAGPCLLCKGCNFCFLLCKTASALCTIFKLHAEIQVFYKDHLSKRTT